MSKIGVSIRIDVTKIDKTRLYKGAKGTYLDMVTFIDTENVDQYENNGFIAESVSKEERAAGVKGTILGNSKIIFNDNVDNQQRSEQYSKGVEQAKEAMAPDFDEDSIPF